MNPTHAETIRAETLERLEAEEDETKWEVFEKFLNDQADYLLSKASVVPVWAAEAFYQRAEQIGETIIIKGIYRKV